MKHAITYIVFLSLIFGLGNSTRIELLPESSNTIISFRVGDFYTSADQGNGVSIHIPEGSQIMDKGSPDLPKLVSSVIVDDGIELGVRIVSSSYKEYKDYNVSPSKGTFTRNINPHDLELSYGENYNKDKFYPTDIVDINSPFIFRDHVGQTITVNPIQYNPISGTLRVYSEIVVEAYPLDSTPRRVTKQKKHELKEHMIDREFSNMYAHKFINYDSSRYQDLDEQGSMLVICYDSFVSAMEPFVNWKNRKGIKTDILPVSQIGSNASSIQSYISNLYYESDLTYVLLVGDINQIPSPSHEGAPSDPFYGYIDGNDFFPEIMVGRFSAESISHVNTQVERTINYERMPDTGDWYKYGVGVASSEGAGAGDQGEADYQHLDIIREKLMEYTYNDVDQLYETNGGSYNMVSQAVNAGRSIINYTGHGWDQGWATTGFDNNGVNALTNTNNLPFIVSVACVNGAFQNGTSFAEAWLRATDVEGNPTGAIAMAASTVNQQWAQPMEGQDEFNDILVESYENNVKRSFGGLFYNANMLMVETYGSSGESEASHWTLFGDPSVIVRTDTPSELYVSYDQTVVVGSTEINIVVDSVEGFAALSKDNELLSYGYSDNGQISLDITDFDLVPGEYDLVVTSYNRVPYEGIVNVITPNGPYIVTNSSTIISETSFSNNQVDYGEFIDMKLSVENVGTEIASNVQVSVSTDSEHLQLINSQLEFNDIGIGMDEESINSFSFYVDIGTPDNYIANLVLDISSDQDSWVAEFPIEVHSPVFEISSHTLVDQNMDGNWDPGEEASINVTLSNSGSAPFYLTPGVVISTDNSDVEIYTDEQTWYGIDPDQSYLAEFSVYASEDSPQGSIANFTVVWGPYYEIEEGCPTGDCVANTSSSFEYSIGLPFNESLLPPDNLNAIASEDGIILAWSAPVWCDEGYVPDCNGDCAYEGWIGDGVCDDDYDNTTGSYAYFNCEEFDFDGGDCLSSLSFGHSLDIRFPASQDIRDDREIVMGYNVFRDGSYIGFSESTTYQDSDINPGVLYCYTVTATYENGQSFLTDELCITSLGNSFVLGDLNNDQVVNIVDVIIMVNMVIGNIELDFEIGDINSDGFIDILDIISIVNFILGPDLNKLDRISIAQLDVGDSQIKVSADSPIAGIEIVYSGNVEFDRQALPQDIILEYSDSKILLVNTSRENSEETMEISFTGILEINEAIIAGWDLSSVNADIVNKKFQLGASYPNPFNPSTTIPYTLADNALVSIEVYDISGQFIESLVNEYKEIGSYNTVWDASKIASGVYIVKIIAGDFSDYQKIILLK